MRNRSSHVDATEPDRWSRDCAPSPDLAIALGTLPPLPPVTGTTRSANDSPRFVPTLLSPYSGPALADAAFDSEGKHHVALRVLGICLNDVSINSRGRDGPPGTDISPEFLDGSGPSWEGGSRANSASGNRLRAPSVGSLARRCGSRTLREHLHTRVRPAFVDPRPSYSPLCRATRPSGPRHRTYSDSDRVG
ncbi:unnamed protein product [Gemmata massiliana]|uniref:Uncharacterized protein n=1 Tax=Gemmata massiliana TaxID=1210884 RepID=A0A6P2DA85_9BACT|nr:unnamed protein product [Gemmata massiliana]